MSDKKYTSPEHAIRNIMELKSIGHNVPTANAFFKPVGVISPPKGDEHVDGAAEKIRASRNIAKERQSETMKEESPEYSSEPGWQPSKKSIGDVVMGKIKKAKQNVAQWKMGREATKKGEKLTTYKELPSEKIKHVVADALTKISGDPQKGEKAAETLGKIGSALTLGVGDIAMSGADAAAAAKQGRTIEAKQKAIEAGVGAAAALAGGAVVGKTIGKYAAPRVGAEIAATVQPKLAAPQTKPPTISQAKPETIKAPETSANFYNPKTQKTYKSKAESDIATKEFDLAAAAKKAGGQAQAKTQADVSAPTKEKVDIKLELPTSKGELTVPGGKKPAAPEVEAIPKGQEKTFPGQGAPKKTTKPPTIELKATEVTPPKAPKTAEKPQDFEMPKGAKKAESKGPTAQKAPEVEIPKGPSVKEKEPPIKFKFAEPPTSKGELVPVTKQPAKVEPKIELKPKVSNVPAVKMPTDVAPSTKVVPKLETKPEVKVAPEVKTKTEVKVAPEVKVKPEVKTKPEVKVAPATKTAPAVKTSPATKPPVPGKTPPSGKKPSKRGRFPFALPGLTPGQSVGVHQDSYVPVDIYKHVPKEYMTFEQTRYDIENVARPSSKDKVKVRSKQAEIIRKIIEEKKPSKKNTTVIINPELKQQEPEQTK